MRHRTIAVAALALVSACGSRARPADTTAQPAPADVAAPAPGPDAEPGRSEAAPGQAVAAAVRQNEGRGRSDEARGRGRRLRADRTTITREELDQFGATATTLYDFVMSRHSDWTRSTGGSRLESNPGAARAESMGRAVAVTVYLDGVRLGANPDALRTIPLGSVQLARRLSPSEAESKYGLDNGAGTIEVWTSLDRVR